MLVEVVERGQRSISEVAVVAPEGRASALVREHATVFDATVYAVEGKIQVFFLAVRVVMGAMRTKRLTLSRSSSNLL